MSAAAIEHPPDRFRAVPSLRLYVERLGKRAFLILQCFDFISEA
jgi:hypothetical protein